MRKAVRILMGLSAVLLVAVSCSSGRGRVIPRGRLSRIYADMLVMDEWIACHSGYNRMADTSFVYRPILEKYGYDEADYRRSVAKYMLDPDRYSRILQKTADMLEAKHKHLQYLQERLDSASAGSFIHMDFPDSLHYLAGMRNPTNMVDFGGVTFYVDSIPGTSWRFDPASGYDTLFCGPRIIIIQRDTLAVADTIEVADTPVVADTVVAVDMIAAFDTVPQTRILKRNRTIQQDYIRDAQIR